MGEVIKGNFRASAKSNRKPHSGPATISSLVRPRVRDAAFLKALRELDNELVNLAEKDRRMKVSLRKAKKLLEKLNRRSW
jgi:hypothetical protein